MIEKGWINEILRQIRMARWLPHPVFRHRWLCAMCRLCGKVRHTPAFPYRKPTLHSIHSLRRRPTTLRRMQLRNWISIRTIRRKRITHSISKPQRKLMMDYTQQRLNECQTETERQNVLAFIRLEEKKNSTNGENEQWKRKLQPQERTPTFLWSNLNAPGSKGIFSKSMSRHMTQLKWNWLEILRGLFHGTSSTKILLKTSWMNVTWMTRSILSGRSGD